MSVTGTEVRRAAGTALVFIRNELVVGTSQAQSLNLTKSSAQSLDVARSGFPAHRIVQRNCLFMTSVAFFEFQIYTANQREGASPPLARS
jgi:hypothetical protein